MSEEDKKKVIQEIISFYTAFEKEVLDVFPTDILEISPILFRALREIYFSSDITSSVLAKRLSITVPNTSRCLKQLSDLGYVIKVKDKNDRRVTHIKLTDNGLELVEKSTSLVDDLILKKLSVLQLDELVELSEAFSTVTKLLNKIGTLTS
ncbi:MarR family winged helix-turn-helix transcriptional regulator [Clostridium omnivorum]|uniref:HTH marR-type domain-containing protein n=1 Tax=Clostridium omnivorum TaxID=1604902 RepID=A0ABQ5N8N5_9CLOT|nr:MarR family winged helix-turn-helix transcriptional regulator [Clostridium sp. E14]GLC31604.1 hypothetical protein bsdE14_30140 [Clostridium sp. E14]